MSSAHEGDPVAISGVALLTPLTDDPDALMRALYAGDSALRDGSTDGAPAEARLHDFDAKRYANIRGMRVYPRNTQMQICAAVQALGTAGLALGAVAPEALGTVTASTYAHTETLIEYDRGLVMLGVQRTNPTLFPLSLPSAPGALTALSLNAKAFAITVSDGDASGIAAVSIAARMIAQQRAEVAVVTAAFSQCSEITASAQASGLLSTRLGVRPFDRHSAGTALGEVAVALVLESRRHANERGQPILGAILGYGATFANTDTARAHALVRAGRRALSSSSASDLALVVAGASGVPNLDAVEARALHELLGAARTEVAVTAPKAALGESLDASGLVQTAIALRALREGRAPGVPALREPLVGGLRYQTESGPVMGARALVTSVSHTGATSALLLGLTP